MALTTEYTEQREARYQPVVAGAAARDAAFRAARRHTFLVRFLRFALPVAAFAFLASFFVSTKLSLPEGFDYSIAKTTIGRNGITMEKPMVTGTDGANRQYVLSADRAVQKITEPDKVHLDNIRAEIRVPDHGPVDVTAASGDYDNSAGTLHLEGGVTAYSPDGYTLRFEDADFDFNERIMKTGNAVEIVVQDARTRADTMHAAEGGEVLVLEGNVRTVLMPPNRPQATTESGEGTRP